MKPDLEQLKACCLHNSQLSASVIDAFLIYYAAEQDKTDREFDGRLKRYKHVLGEFPATYPGMIKSQYIAHRIFRKGGLLNRYLHHAAIKNLPAVQRQFLKDAAGHPWFFCYGKVSTVPGDDFYEMTDLFRGDTYLLHSPAMSGALKEGPVSIWFNLIGFNGSCWQTFGPVGYFRGLSTDDIFFFATEVNEFIDSDDGLLVDVEQNPVPYMLMMLAAELPFIEQQGYETVMLASSTEALISDWHPFQKDFRIEYASHVFHITHLQWSSPPHFAEAYYDEEEQTLSVYSFTDHGYQALTDLLNEYGLMVQEEPDIRLHIPMHSLIEKLLQKKLEINPYSQLFTTAQPEAEKTELDKLNKVLALALPYINDGKEPDFEHIAAAAKVPVEMAAELIRTAKEQISKMLDRR